MNLNKLSKPIITLCNPQDTRKLCSFDVHASKAGRLSLETKPDTYGQGYRFVTELRNQFGKRLGFEQFALFKNSENSTGLLISVEPEYRNRHYYLGEILRLASIIDIIENKIKSFDIYSKSSAIYFHSKYKFKPAITSFEERNHALKTVMSDNKCGFEDLASSAQSILNAVESTHSAKVHRKLCDLTNELIDKYITRVLSTRDFHRHPFKWGISMKLSAEDIVKNKDFFNSLFKKHGIDYKI